MKTIFIGTSTYIYIFMNTQDIQCSLFGQEIPEKKKLQTCKLVFNCCVTHYVSFRTDCISGPLCKKTVHFHEELLSILKKEKV